jgi:hypothetical protein
LIQGHTLVSADGLVTFVLAGETHGMTLTFQQGLLFWPGIILVAVSFWLLISAIRRGPDAYSSQDRKRTFMGIAVTCSIGAALLLALVFVD